jgi:hypothetical protein
MLLPAFSPQHSLLPLLCSFLLYVSPAKHRKLLACLCQGDLTLHFHCPLQTRIAEYIRQKNVEENFEAAMEFNPEVFAQVTMLYVTMDVGTSQCLRSMTKIWLVNLFSILSFAVHCILQHVTCLKPTFQHGLSSSFHASIMP